LLILPSAAQIVYLGSFGIRLRPNDSTAPIMADAAINHVTIPRFDLGPWNWTFNATHYMPSAKDLALAGPRMFMKLGSFFVVPEAVDNIFGGARLGNRIIPEATGAGIVDAITTAAAIAGADTREAIQTGTQLLVGVDQQSSGATSRFTMEGVRSLGNVFSYATSKWALGCILVAVILNRTYVYASTRRNLTLPWKIRLLLRSVPILLLILQCRAMLQSLQCQSSPDFGLLRWGNASKTSTLMFTQNGGFLHELSSTLLFGASDEASCLAVRMIAPEYDEQLAKASPEGEMPPAELKGSLSLLWPTFKLFCFSQFIETISCAVQGRHVAAETGMSLFEHSLAFAEAEGQIGNQLGFGAFGHTRNAWSNTNSTAEATKIAITRSMIMKKVNTTPEVLLVGLISSMNHLTSHVLAIFNMQAQLRLLNTGFWGLTFMSAIVWSIWSFSMDDLENQSLLRFPTVSIVGFIPHVLIFFGILGCAIIYGAALILSALVPPPTEYATMPDEQVAPRYRSRFFHRLWAAHQNMQANVPLSNIRITQHMDFYTALLRTGFAIMTMASEAVYLNESRGLSVKQRTWLEEERIQEIESIGAQWLGPTFKLHDPDSSFTDGLNGYVGLVAADQTMDGQKKVTSGYAREMTAKKNPKPGSGRDRPGVGINGVGAAERSGRWIMALEFFLSINRLLLTWWASLALKFLAAAGFQRQPRILLWLVRVPKTSQADTPTPVDNEPQPSEFWVVDSNGEMARPKDDRVDVEQETRKRMRSFQSTWSEGDEKQLDLNLYKWWLGGGWWGADDNSGSYAVDENTLDDDTTSVVSFSTTGDEQDWESESENDDGRTTPTQSLPQYSREGTPFLDTPLDMAGLAELLHPKTPEQRAEAQTLAVHLANDGIVTRSRYRNLLQHERAKVLTSSRHRPDNFVPSSPSGKLNSEEEAQLLEHLIISRRNFRAAASSSLANETSWDKGASGMGEGGPQCVVCQCSPRSIIVWPCRCLSLCDDCRVTLAMNNFDKCVCCRRDVASFSRIFVP
jgi:hypothetical protein